MPAGQMHRYGVKYRRGGGTPYGSLTPSQLFAAEAVIATDGGNTAKQQRPAESDFIENDPFCLAGLRRRAGE